ncbi:SPOR domain-containing protein [Bartonella bilalgolemii]|uniref:SPOR domain-containing protein n=1 Tax=Bartonella bilalgolemii TaxID=2942911 RepID=A0ABT0P8N7_9HYPH|nr:SPOR domain-containing protein [Bartonella sp. G70]MCL6229831.1 SPOR domain-containing protein [Bartonella sp. G70]
MSDNDRKNPEEMKQDHEHYDPLERLTRIFNSNLEDKQKNFQNTQSSLKSEHLAAKTSDVSSSANNVDLPFMEDITESNSVGELPFDDSEQWSPQLNVNNQNYTNVPEYPLHTYNHEEKILNTLSPLPIPNTQATRDRSESVSISSSFETNNFNTQTQNSFPDEVSAQSGYTSNAALYKETKTPLQTNEQQPDVYSLKPKYAYQKNTYNTSIKYSYEIPTAQQKFVENHHTDIPISSTDTRTFSSSANAISNINSITMDESTNVASTMGLSGTDKSVSLEDFSQEKHIINHHETKILKEDNVTKSSLYNNVQIQYTKNDNHNTKNDSKNNGQREQYNQKNSNYTHTSLETLNIAQTDSFPVGSPPHSYNSPPNVDTCKFAEEIVERTEPIMVSEVAYEEPKYDVSNDGLEKEFTDVFGLGSNITKNFSQKQQNEAFYPAKKNLTADLQINTQEQNTSYSFPDNGKDHSSSFPEDLQYGYAHEIPANTLANSSQKSFTIGGILSKSIAFLILAAIGLFSYVHFFMLSDTNESPNIIRADNTPFKVKPEITEAEDNITHNLDLYKQITEKNEKQENAQQFLFDNSEAPEDLTALNKQTAENPTSSSLNKAYVEDAITAALNHTIPTHEVKTVVVKPDGTTVLAPVHHTNEEPFAQSEITNKSKPEQSQKQSSVSSQSSDVKNNEKKHSFTNSEKTQHTLITDVDHIITESNATSAIQEKTRNSFVPIPSSAQLNSKIPMPTSSHSNPLKQTTVQSEEKYYVQLSSQPTYELAQNSLRKIKSKFGSIIGPRPLNIQSALISGKGTYYRVRIQTQNRNEAVSLCEDIKQSGGSCFITS